MGQKPHYTDEFRAGAVLMLEAAGWPEKKGVLHEVSGRLGLHDMTLLRWARRQQNPAPNQLVIDQKIELADIVDFIFRGFASELMARIAHGDLIDEQTTTLLTGFGIGFDKVQLLAGKPTGRTDHTVDVEINWQPVNYRNGLPEPDGDDGE